MANYYHNVDGVQVPFSAEEEAAKVIEMQAWTDGEVGRKWTIMRRKRNILLTESDWTQYNDSPLTDEVKAEWAVHRQLLRDLPDTTDDPADPTWPEVPE